MSRILFNSKKLYIANVLISISFLLITILSLYSLVVGGSDRMEMILYVCYLIIYTSASPTLLLKIKKAIFSLHVIYSFAIVLNLFDFGAHYSKYDDLINRRLFIIIITVYTVLFSSLIYLNNKNRFRLNVSELDEIGKL